MATSPEAIRADLEIVMGEAVAELLAEVEGTPLDRLPNAMLTAASLIVPPYYDATGALAVDWYDELRDEARPAGRYAPRIIGDATTGWIDREVAVFRRALGSVDLEAQVAALADEIARLAQKEVGRGFRDSIVGNTRTDTEAIGWSRVTRSGACKFCQMLAARGAFYRSESTAIFAAHGNCHCAARPAFRNGEHGPEANAMQYVASSKRARTEQEQATRNAKVRKYLNANFPDARG